MKRKLFHKEFLRGSPHIKPHEVDKIVNIIIDEIISTIDQQHRLEIRKFGVFSARITKQRRGINPKTKELTIYPATKTPTFKPSKILLKKLQK